jgi:spermidine/putrescine transport system substrate-binding protein
MNLKNLTLRSLVTLFWIGLIFGILYFPKTLLFREKQSINVFAWGDILEPSVVAEFEKKSGIKVNLNFYASNEEMIVKMKATGGEGYDLIVPSDYSVEILRKEKLLKEIDKSQLSFYSQLNPLLLNHPFDPDNRYSIPFEWEIFLLGIDKDYFQHHPLNPSWKMVFDETSLHYRITMSNDPIQTFCMASYYLFGSQNELSPTQLDQVTQLLISQKKWVNAYADFRADYFLATKNSAVVVSSSSYLWRTMKKFPFVGYVIPQEGTFLSIENLCIPQSSQKQHLTYQLINFLYSRASMKTHFETYGIFPATLDVLDDLMVDESTHDLISLSSPELQSIQFTKLLSSQENIRDAWIKVKTN